MTAPLNPTEAQRKAMAVELKAFGGWTLETCHKAVAAVIAAANSIPEGPPVGTGALQPGGAFVAIRVAGPYWTYVNVNQDDDAAWPHPDAADSWPVIFAPGEAVGSGPTTDGGETYDPRDHPSREELQEYFHKDLAEHCQADDPTAQQEPEEPGPPSNAHIKFPKAPRTPRVVDRLGVDEQGSRWLDAFGLVWSFGNGWWKSWGTG